LKRCKPITIQIGALVFALYRIKRSEIILMASGDIKSRNVESRRCDDAWRALLKLGIMAENIDINDEVWRYGEMMKSAKLSCLLSCRQRRHADTLNQASTPIIINDSI